MKIALIALSGSSIEWYDFFIYATAAALVFPTLFFSGDLPPLVATLASFSTFAVAFVARPIGGILFGHFGDKLGRKGALVTALLLMGASTTAIGLLPSYATIGAAAPILLVVLRLLQGLALGGQWGGAMLIATENAPANRRGFYGSFAQLGLPAGIVIANLTFLLISSVMAPESFAAWGWRIPFLLSVLLIGVGIYAQVRLEDTPAFQRVKQAHTQARSPITEVLKRYPKEVALAAGAFTANNAIGYITVVFMLSYGTEVLGLPRPTVLIVVLLAALTWIPELLWFSALSDRLGRKKVFAAGAAFLAIWAFPFFWLVNTGSALLMFVALAVGSVGLNMMYGPQAAISAELFGTRVRYSGASLGYQLSSILGGALAPIIATSLIAATGTSSSISVYMIVLCLISLVSVLLMAETYRRNIDETQGKERQQPIADARRGGAATP